MSIISSPYKSLWIVSETLGYFSTFTNPYSLKHLMDKYGTDLVPYVTVSKVYSFTFASECALQIIFWSCLYSDWTHNIFATSAQTTTECCLNLSKSNMRSFYNFGLVCRRSFNKIPIWVEVEPLKTTHNLLVSLLSFKIPWKIIRNIFQIR